MTLITIFERIPLMPGSKIERAGNLLVFTRDNGKSEHIHWNEWYAIEESSIAEQIKENMNKIEYK